jgi:hypothetical protein
VVLQQPAEKQRRNALMQTGMEGTLGQGPHITTTKCIYQEVSLDKIKYWQS